MQRGLLHQSIWQKTYRQFELSITNWPQIWEVYRIRHDNDTKNVHLNLYNEWKCDHKERERNNCFSFSIIPCSVTKIVLILPKLTVSVTFYNPTKNVLQDHSIITAQLCCCVISISWYKYLKVFLVAKQKKKGVWNDNNNNNSLLS